MLGSYPTGLVISQLQQRIRQVAVTAKGNIAAGKSRSRVLKKGKVQPI